MHHDGTLLKPLDPIGSSTGCLGTLVNHVGSWNLIELLKGPSPDLKLVATAVTGGRVKFLSAV